MLVVKIEKTKIVLLIVNKLQLIKVLGPDKLIVVNFLQNIENHLLLKRPVNVLVIKTDLVPQDVNE